MVSIDTGRLQQLSTTLKTNIGFANDVLQVNTIIVNGKCLLTSVACLHIGEVCVDTYFHINSNVLPIAKQCLDLGVTISDNLQSSEHIKIIVAKAHQRANPILRCFASRDTNLLVRAFNVYVRPQVEYITVLCGRHT